MGIYAGSHGSDMGSYCCVRPDSRGNRDGHRHAFAYRDLTTQESNSVAAALEQYRNRPTLGFADCLVLEIARKAGHLPLGTVDRNLCKLDGAEGPEL